MLSQHMFLCNDRKSVSYNNYLLNSKVLMEMILRLSVNTDVKNWPRITERSNE